MIRLVKNRRAGFFLISKIGFLFLVFFIVVMQCSKEDKEVVRKKLDVILADDMKAILEDVPDNGLLENPCYDLVFYKEYGSGNYSHKAVVNFYFLKISNAKIIRKYRYYRKKGIWERYFNEYSFSPDSNSCRTK
ncbi:MAG: hypothetical protein JW915_22380 [Chitinispirillaceae bacterium]|nr:hypothetical protein [Chitinispirillaceae bacterium]